MFTRQLERVGALFLMAGAAGFVAVFLYLQATFGYPYVLALGAGEVLPRLAAGGSGLRAAWLIYSALPLTLLLAGIASMRLLEDGAGRGLARLGAAAASLAAVAMMMGLLRWATIHAVLAERWPTATPEQRAIYSTMFDALNSYLGTFLGELLGELALAGWFACVGVALWRAERRRSGVPLLVAGAIVGVGALRQITAAVAPVVELGNVVLPLGLFGVAGLMLTNRPVTTLVGPGSVAQPRS